MADEKNQEQTQQEEKTAEDKKVESPTKDPASDDLKKDSDDATETADVNTELEPEDKDKVWLFFIFFNSFKIHFSVGLAPNTLFG